MENYAIEAVLLASQFETPLDYSENSLQSLETILSRVATTLPKPDDSAGDERVKETIDGASRIWGGYFGETIRRLWGGDWGVETYPGTVAPVVSIDVGGAKLFPIMKVYRRLTQGESEDVWKFYQMIRRKISNPCNKQ